MMMRLLVTLLPLLHLSVAGQWKYIRLDNTWHDGTQHRTMQTGDLEPVSVQQACASFCSMINTCDGFYIEVKAGVSGVCHLVDEDAEPTKSRKSAVGAGKVYYVKAPMDQASKDLSPGGKGVRDCDADTAQLHELVCTSLYPSGQAFLAGTCADPSTTSLAETVAMPDMKCPGEDRLIGCEILAIEGDKYDDSKRFNLFAKTAIQPKGYESGQEQLSSILMTLKNPPVKLSRIIIRSTSAGGATKLKKAKVVVHSEKKVETMDFTMGDLDCSKMLVFRYTQNSTTWDKAWEKADKIGLSNMEWSGPFNGAMKIDLFTL